MEKDSERQFQLHKMARQHYLYYVIAALLFILANILLLRSNPDLLQATLSTLLVGVTSLAGGFGLKVLWDKRNSE